MPCVLNLTYQAQITDYFNDAHFLTQANKLEETDMKKSYEVFLIGRLLGRIGFVLGILLATIIIAILFIYEVIPR